MSQQGERPTGHEDDWWRQLYDDPTDDTGPAPVADSLDDRFASAAGVSGGEGLTDRDLNDRGLSGRGLNDRRSNDSGRADRGSNNSGLSDRRLNDPGSIDPGAAAAALRSTPAAPTARQGVPPATGPDRPAAGSAPSDSNFAWHGFTPRSPAAAPGPEADADRGGTAAEPLASASASAGAGAGRGSYEDELEQDRRRRERTLRRSGLERQPAPWEPPDEHPRGPVSFPPGPKPPGYRAESAPPDSRAGAVPPGAPAEPTVSGGGPFSGGSGDSGLAGGSGVSEGSGLAGGSGAGSSRASRVSGRAGAGVSGLAERSGVSGGSGRAGGSGGEAPAFAEPPTDGPSAVPDGARTAVRSPVRSARDDASADYVGDGPPTYDAEPTALPPADPDDLDDLMADTVLDGARYGACTLRAVSVRGDSARYRGEPRRDSLLTARFGSGEDALVLVAMATGARATPGAHRAAAEACRWIGRAVGRSHARLVEDIRAARRGELKSGLHRLTDRSLGKLRASAAEQGLPPEEYTAGLRCLLLPADPECRTRVFFGVGPGGLFRLRDGEWQDIEPRVKDAAGEPVVGFGSLPHETPEGDRLTMDLGITTPPSPYEPAPEPPREPFRFRASVARPGDTLLLCSGGLADPLRGEQRLADLLTARWSGSPAPGLAEFLADTQVRVKGYADDRTAAAVWEA
nr:protein phosphatase 2C domain-containing protein [Streptomyces cavernae]